MVVVSPGLIRAGWLPLLSFAVPPGCTPGWPPPCPKEEMEKVKRSTKTADKRFRKLIFAIYSCISAGASWWRPYFRHQCAIIGYAEPAGGSLHLNRNVSLESRSPPAPCR